MYQRFRFPKHINITQRQATLTVLAVYFFGACLALIVDLIAPTPFHATIILVIPIAILIFGLAWDLYYRRNWRPIPYLAVTATTLMVGFSLPEPFLSEQAPLSLLLPIVIALLLTNPIWVIINAMLVWIILLARAGWTGVYADPTTLTIYGMLTGGLLASRAMAETSLQQLRQAQSEIEASEKRFSLAFHASPVPQVISNLITGRTLDANQTYCTLFGYDRGEVIGRTSLELGMWVNPEIHRQIVQRIEAGQQVHHRELAFRTRAGDIRILLVSYEKLEIHHEPCLLATAIDVTERLKVEEQLREGEERFRHAIQDAPYPIQIHAEGGEVLSLNQAWTDITGYTLEQIPTIRAWVEQAYRQRSENVFEEIQRLYSITGRIDEGEEEIYTAQGNARTWKFSSAPLGKLPDGRSVAISMAVDITERKRAEAELSKLNTELEQRVEKRTAELKLANRAKDEFLAAMSHELRTPLNSILGMSESLLENIFGTLTPKQNQYLQNIHSSGRHLLELINDILNLTRIQAGQLQLYPELISTNEVCEACIELVSQQAAKKVIHLEWTKKAHDCFVRADYQRLKQILVNLLDNAVKFTHTQGHVRLQVHSDIEDGLIQFIISDNGIGIAQENLARIFQPFIQVDARLNRNYEGTGLGLALVHKLTDLHGGSLAVESEIGTGSTFTVSLPWNNEFPLPAHAGPKHTNVIQPADLRAAPSPDAGITILLAEDHPYNSLAISDHLKVHGFNIQEALDGLEAVELAQKINPDLILMDIQMPGMDGLEAMRVLRANPRFTATPIIALTALTMPGDRERCLDAGANEYLSKPVGLRKLIETINELLDRGGHHDSL